MRAGCASLDPERNGGAEAAVSEVVFDAEACRDGIDLVQQEISHDLGDLGGHAKADLEASV